MANPIDPWKPVLNWISRQYPRPRINQDWLQQCVDALITSSPTPLSTRDLIYATETQLLLSHLSHSTLPQTGFPSDETLHDRVLFADQPCLVMVIGVQEIGHSAFQMKTVMDNRKEVLSGATRIRRMRDPVDVDGAAADPNVDADADADADAQDDEEHQSQDRLPPYPRGMLHLEVTDGVRVMKAIEYRRIPGLALGDTALGSKMLLKGVKVLRDILLLTPECVTLKHHLVEELQNLQAQLFQNGLRRRMGLEEVPFGDDQEAGNDVQRPEGDQVQMVEDQAAQADDDDIPNEPARQLQEDRPTAGPSRPTSTKPANVNGRFTLPPHLNISNTSRPTTSTTHTHPPRTGGPSRSRGHARTEVEVVEVDDSFSVIEPDDAELEELMRSAEAAPSGAGSGTRMERQTHVVDVDEDEWQAMQEMDMQVDESSFVEEQSRFFGGNKKTGQMKKGKRKVVVDPDDEEDGRANGGMDVDVGRRMGSSSTARPKEHNARKSKAKQAAVTLGDGEERHDDTDEDSQKENRPVHIVVDEDESDERSVPAGRRVATRSRNARQQGRREQEDVEYREVIELSD